MKGWKLNSDLDYAKKILDGIARKGGHCPCRVGKDETSICPCDKFMSGEGCDCNLFLKDS